MSSVSNSEIGAVSIPDTGGKARIPNYAVVISPLARQAVETILSCESRWRNYTQLSDAATVVLAVILRFYAEQARAPSKCQMSQALGLGMSAYGAVLDELVTQDLVIVDASGELIGAYPFIDRLTGHHVYFAETGQMLSAMCAVDALGAGAMVNKDTVVVSTCLWCGAPISIETADYGRQLAAVNPTSATVQIKHTPAVNCAAESLCRDIRLYCSPMHAQYARRDDLTLTHHLNAAEALEVGRALFEQRALFNCSG